MLLKLDQVTKQYLMGDNVIYALRGVSVAVDEGEFVAIMGPSGSGKSTFLQIASILSKPTSGKILLKGKNVSEFGDVERARLRNKEIGFVFQQFNLLARTSALDNVRLPLMYAGVPEDEQKLRAKQILEKVGLQDRLENTPAQLSGGQQQRVAIARALINNPSIVFADEPTGNLDSKSGEEIKKLLCELNQEGKTIIMVTHEQDVAEVARRFITFQDGQIVVDSANPKAKCKTKTMMKARRKSSNRKKK